VVGFAPIGVRDLDVIEANPGDPAPVDRDPGDLGLAAGDGAGMLFDLSADVVGVTNT
jgi:hypothetical protein